MLLLILNTRFGILYVLHLRLKSIMLLDMILVMEALVGALGQVGKDIPFQGSFLILLYSDLGPSCEDLLESGFFFFWKLSICRVELPLVISRSQHEVPLLHGYAHPWHPCIFLVVDPNRIRIIPESDETRWEILPS